MESLYKLYKLYLTMANQMVSLMDGGRKCESDCDGCKYRHGDLRSPIGALLTCEDYHWRLESVEPSSDLIMGILENSLCRTLSDAERKLIYQVEHIHDNVDIDDWKGALIELESEYGFNISIFDVHNDDVKVVLVINDDGWTPLAVNKNQTHVAILVNEPVFKFDDDGKVEVVSNKQVVRYEIETLGMRTNRKMDCFTPLDLKYITDEFNKAYPFSDVKLRFDVNNNQIDHMSVDTHCVNIRGCDDDTLKRIVLETVLD